MAADPRNGHIFVGDQTNKRINEFNALGQLVKSWGWDVVASGPGNTGTGFEICIPANGDVCKAGLSGAGVGQLASPQGLAVDSAGSVYVVDRPNHRVEKFSRKGEFQLMFGGGVDQGGGSPANPGNLCTAEYVANGDTCGAGTTGAANGQFSANWVILGDYIAIDSTDKIYVGDENRIQRFDTGGGYQGEIAVPGVVVQSLDVDASGNLYAIYSGQNDVRKLTSAGVELSSPRFVLKDPEGSVVAPTAVAVDSAGDVFAFGPISFSAGKPMDPIFEFDPAGNLIANFGQGEFSASTGLAANLCAGSEAPGSLYATNANNGAAPPGSSSAFLRAYGTDPIGCFKARTLPAAEIEELKATLKGTVDPDGLAVSECLFEYGTTTTYGHTAACEAPGAAEITGTDPVAVHAHLSSLQKGTVYHFRLIAKVGGEVETGSDVQFKTLGPPVISADHTDTVSSTEASLKALVNPEGFAAEYHFEYGTSTAYGNSTPLIGVGEDRTDHAAVANLKGLAPNTTYHWRIVASNTAAGNPVVNGKDHELTTHIPFSPEGGCPNEALRSGASAFLPDCRAYEMVSPVDKNGADIIAGLSGVAEPGGYVQVSPDGSKITYATISSFADQHNSFAINQYLASRAGGGWTSQGIHPAIEGAQVDAIQFGNQRDFIAFAPDLCSAWLIDYQTPAPTADGQEGFRNLYRRENCGPGAGGLEALAPEPPPLPVGTHAQYVTSQSVQGVSGDGSRAFFAASTKLNAEAAGGFNPQVYDRHDGSLSVVSILPNGNADIAGDEVGSNWGFNLDNAVSADGSRVYWTSGIESNSGFGKIYVREHPEQGKAAGECEGESACTRQVSGPTAGFFWKASEDGSRALFGESGGLWEFDLQKAKEKLPPRRLIAEDVQGVAGASEDLSRIYFVDVPTPATGTGDLAEGSATVTNVKTTTGTFRVGQSIEGAGIPTATTIAAVGAGTLSLSAPATSSGVGVALKAINLLTGAQENSEGDKAQEGQPNLYLKEGGTFRFVATLAAGDAGAVEPGASEPAYDIGAKKPYERATRVSADGSRIAFESRARLTVDKNGTHIDNTDEAGHPAVEVFIYEAGGQLTCVSCNPGGAQPSTGGRELPIPYQHPWLNGLPTKVYAAAWIPTWQHSLYDSKVLSSDGGRLFFNSNDALVPRDANGAQDVYEWEVPGKGSCTTSRPSYRASNGGCIYLISSGESAFESEFWGASPSGGDVFFTTESSFAPQDPGLLDLYDARAGGGEVHPAAASSCEGEACQSPPPAPEFPTPASSSYDGPGNSSHKAHHKKKNKKKKQKHKRRRANHSRRAAR